MKYDQESKKHILVVYNNSKVRLDVHDYLTPKGYSITVAVSGKSALEIYQRCSDKRNKPPAYYPIDLVLTDMEMPSMSGYELFYELKRINPEAKICVMTGDLDRYTEEIEEMKSKGLVGAVQNPFIMDDAVQKQFIMDKLDKLVESALK